MNLDFKELLNRLPEALIVANLNDKIIYSNLRSQHLFNYTLNEFIDMPIQNLISKIEINEFNTLKKNSMSNSTQHFKNFNLKCEGRKKNDISFPMELSFSYFDHEGVQIYLLSDISIKSKLNERFETLLELAPDAIVIVNKMGLIELANLQTERLFGYSKKELIGQKIEKLMPNRFREKHHEHRNGFAANPHVRPMGSGLKLYGMRKDNTEFPIEISLSPIENEGLVAAAIRDVTEKFLNNYLKNKTKQLEDFAYITSHNLRSPVLNLALLLNFYKEEETESGKHLLIEKFEQTVSKLSETLNNLMDVLIIQQDTNKVKVNLKFETLFKKALLNLETFITESNAEIIADFSEAPEIEFSKIYLESIFQNLINNSIKYASPERKPVIRIFTEKIDDKIQLTISDNGLGIDLSKHGSKIFGLNKTFHKHPDAKGVGLFITKAQITAMGGQIYVSSEVNIGTTFKIIF